jgi:hypothetical protein
LSIHNPTNRSANPLAGVEVTSAPDKDKHDFLVSLLKESRYRMVDFMFKQAAVLTLLIGWILSSKEAREFIAGAPIVRKAYAFAVALYALLSIFWAWTFRRRSKCAHKHLLELRYMPEEFYSTLLVTKPLTISFVSMHVAGCAVLIAFLFQIH